jgi:DNA polymerase
MARKREIEEPLPPKSLKALNRLILDAPSGVKGGTRAVLGEGPIGADIAFVGEQPGDQEDVAGRPFVGPAGKLLDRAMQEAGIDRKQTYVTNAVKHFKFEQRGKRRLHSKPGAGEVKHYRWWLQKELDLVKPRLVVALGATAALALAGKPIAVSRHRGPFPLAGRAGYVTIHPSFLLRMPPQDRAQAWKQFLSDMKQIRKLASAEKKQLHKKAA